MMDSSLLDVLKAHARGEGDAQYTWSAEANGFGVTKVQATARSVFGTREEAFVAASELVDLILEQGYEIGLRAEVAAVFDDFEHGWLGGLTLVLVDPSSPDVVRGSTSA
jgi:hypothetical protein